MEVNACSSHSGGTYVTSYCSCFLVSLETVITAYTISFQLQMVLTSLGDELVGFYFFPTSLNCAFVVSPSVYMDMSVSTCGGLMKSLDSLEMKFWTMSQCGCWEQNSGPLKEHQVLLTSGPSGYPASL